MAIVNKINIKKSKVKSCADFADVFIERILDESFGYDEVRVVFDRYVKKSLKTQTRISRTKGYSTVYRVMDETKIDDLETKSFLSSIETKNDLTKYLSNKLPMCFWKNRFVTSPSMALHVKPIFKILISPCLTTVKRKQIQV